MNDTNKCFECGSLTEIQEHHIIPRSLGGKKTVKLCGECHGKIQSVNFSNHGLLIRKALAKLKSNGVKLGRPEGRIENLKILRKHSDIHLCLLDNMSIRNIAKHTNKGVSTVQRVKKILENEKNKV